MSTYIETQTYSHKNTIVSNWLFCAGACPFLCPDWGRLEYAIFPTNILTRHVYCPCVEFIQSILVLSRFWKHQLASSLTISGSTVHASAVEKILPSETKVELSTRMERDDVSLVTLHASAIEETIEAGFEIITSEISCRSLVDCGSPALRVAVWWTQHSAAVRWTQRSVSGQR